MRIKISKRILIDLLKTSLPPAIIVGGGYEINKRNKNKKIVVVSGTPKVKIKDKKDVIVVKVK